jgi:UDP-3-O-[3-hydroxymyristoyl] glucosamine N-acyltransferase
MVPGGPTPHETATVLCEVEAGEHLSVGPYSVIGYDPSRLRGRFHGRDLQMATNARVIIGDNVTIGSHCVIEAGARIGNNCYIDHGSFVGADTTLSDDVMLRYRAQVHRRIIIGAGSIVGGFLCNDTILGAECDIFGSCVHNYIGVPRGTRELAPRLGRNVFVGFNAVVVGDVTLADNAVVRAGLLVTPDAVNPLNSDPIQSPSVLDRESLGGA